MISHAALVFAPDIRGNSRYLRQRHRIELRTELAAALDAFFREIFGVAGVRRLMQKWAVADGLATRFEEVIVPMVQESASETASWVRTGASPARNEASPREFLRGYPALRTRDPDELSQWLRSTFAVRNFDMPGRGVQFRGVLNRCSLPSLDLTFLAYGGPIKISTDQHDVFVQGVPVAGAGKVSAMGKDVTVGVDFGTTCGPGSTFDLDYGEGFQHLALRITPEVLSAKLAALTGDPVDPPIVLAGPGGNRALLAAQARLVRFLADEIEKGITALAPLLLAELEQAIIVSYLEAYEHNYSHLLRGTPRSAAPWQVKRAIDYIEEHWNEAITIEALSAASETSARSLFNLFRNTYGHSPMIRVNRVRLRHARERLLSPEPGVSVTEIGFDCGFSNLGTFARKYREAYGENPSDTLRSHL